MKEAILQAGEDLIRLLDYQDEDVRKLVKKGLTLYRQGYVYNLKELEHYTGVVVYDEQEQMVLLNLNDLSGSECDCQHPSFCAHRLAGFFYAYATKGLVGNLLDKWKQQSLSSQITSSLDAFRLQKSAAPQRRHPPILFKSGGRFLSSVMSSLPRQNSLGTHPSTRNFMKIFLKG